MTDNYMITSDTDTGIFSNFLKLNYLKINYLQMRISNYNLHSIAIK